MLDTQAFRKHSLNECRQETHSWIKGGSSPIMHLFLYLLNKHSLSTWLQGHSRGNDNEKGNTLKTMVHLHNGILHSREKEGAPTLCDSMDGTGEHYAK